MKKMCDIASKWWADKCDGYTMHDNGAYDATNALAMMIADIMNKPVSKATKQLFIEHLSAKIQNKLEKDGYNELYLDCDYSPCRILAEAANEVGINLSNFPFKTGMSIDPKEKKIIVYDGYGAKPEVIYDEGMKWQHMG